MGSKLRGLAVGVIVVALSLGLVTPARASSFSIWTAQTASANGTEIAIAGNSVVNVMICGTGFSGTVTIKQGPMSGKLADIALTPLAGGTPVSPISFTTISSCQAYYALLPSALIRVDFTRTAGTLDNVILETER